MGNSGRQGIDRKRIELMLGRAAVLTLSRLALTLSDPVALRLGSSLGSMAYSLSKRYRTVTRANLASVFGDVWDQTRIERTARDVFRHIGMNFLEFLRFRSMDPRRLDEMVDVEGEEHILAALERGKGVLAVTGHFGNFELFAAAMVRKGYHLSVIARDADDNTTNNLINGIRERMGYQVFSRQWAARRSLTELRNNHILGLLPDQNDASGIFVPFFGRLAASAPGAAYLALHSGAALVPAYIHREANMRHKVHIYPPIEYSPVGDRDTDIYNLTLLINHALEREIRLYPEQWFWLHKRWKTRPPAEGGAILWSPARHARQPRTDASQGQL